MNRGELNNTDFNKYCYLKFKKGALEHKETWDYDTIKPLWEMLEECADLHNYSSLVAEKYPFIGNKYKKISKEMWEEIKNTILIYKQ